MSDYPPLYTALMKGQDADGNEIVLAADTTRALLTVLTGEDSGELETIAVDEEGRIIAKDKAHKFFLTYADQTATTTTTEIQFPFPWSKIELINAGETDILFNINASADAINTVLTAGTSKVINIQSSSISFKTSSGSSTLRIRGSGWKWWCNTHTETITITDAVALLYGFEYSEAFSISESLIWEASMMITEQFSIVEGVLLNVGIPISEAFSISESMAITIEILLSEAIGISEVVIVNVDAYISEALSITETIDLMIPIIEEFSITETIIISLMYGATEEFTIEDVVSFIADCAFTESISLSDSVKLVGGFMVTESFSITDEVDGTKGASGVHTYVCDDSDAQGYSGYTTADGSFGGTSSEFTSVDYSAIDGDDNSKVTDFIGVANNYQYHRFDFTIDEDIGDITQVTITWRGYCKTSTAYRSELWIKEGGFYVERDSHTSSSKNTLDKTYTSGLSNIVQSGHVYVGVQNGNKSTGPGAPAYIYSYYVKVDITYDSEEDLFP